MKPPIGASTGFLFTIATLVAVVVFSAQVPVASVEAPGTKRQIRFAELPKTMLSAPGLSLEASAPDFGVSSVNDPRVRDPSSLTDSWGQFRGPQSKGITSRFDLPVEWSANKHIYWESNLPGRGASSPVAYIQRVYVTSSSGYGDSFKDRGGIRYLKHHVMALNSSNGKTVWRRDIVGSKLTQELNHQILNHGFASSSPACDGTNIYAFFGASGVFAFGQKGNLLWHADVGFEHSKYGSAASLVLHNNLLIVNASAESEAVIALDTKTGKGVWRIEGVKNSWSTPVVGRDAEGKPELIVQDDGRVRGFDIATGKERWVFRGPEGYAASTPFVRKGVCFFTAGSSKTLTAIKLGGKGDVTDDNKYWSVGNVSRHTSPIFLNGNVYALSESGVFRCFNARDGKLVNAQRIPTKGRVYTSPILAGSYFYLPTGGNRFFVCEANSQLKMVRDNNIDQDMRVYASLTPSANSFLIRSESGIQCAVNSTRGKRAVSVEASKFKVTENRPRYEFDLSSAKLRKFNEYLSSDDKVQVDALLQPLEQQITYDERQLSETWMTELVTPLKKLRERQRLAYWRQLSEDKRTRKMLEDELRAIEAETLETAIVIQEKIAKRLEAEKTSVVSSVQ